MKLPQYIDLRRTKGVMIEVTVANLTCSSIRRLSRLGLCCCAMVAASAILFTPALSARAATSAAVGSGTITIGSVDITKVLAGYDKKSTSEADFQKVVDQYDSAFKMQQANFMLSSTDQQTLSQLLLKANPTAADQDEIRSLQTKSQNDSAELTTLQQKQNMTDTDKARLSTLTTEQQAGQQALQGIADSYKTTLDAKNAAESQKIAEDVRAAVSSIAQQKGLTVVLDSSVAIYAANDVTQAVITKLNAGNK